MKKLLPLLFLSLCVSCDIPTDGMSQNGRKSAPTKTKIDFQGNTIVLPQGYLLISAEEFENRIESIADSSKFKKMAKQELEKVKNRKVEYQLFIDPNNSKNFVFVYTRNYVEFDEFIAQKYVSNLNKELKRESNKQRIKYRRIHGRYFFTNTSKIVKLKYIKAVKQEQKFQTEYLISSQSGGMGLLVSNTQNIDFETSVKGLAMR
ncbi:hypothetical protein ACFSTE_01725 [Aquimarina hainanensis]|uniref:Uncharacterized protein n=1 Tax=Aquimarina hainanensis TaxID=1578017 RepID=A0ABW5N215_9FLAO|nr:hypothetical protein [Aquimarina sp. TRL1]QKX04361.1 hypothetical protein HN014_05365 [Aquimarina sp. TRL1]